MKVQNNCKIVIDNMLPLNVEVTYFYTSFLACRYEGKINNILHTLFKEYGITYSIMSYGLYLNIPNEHITKINYEGL